VASVWAIDPSGRLRRVAGDESVFGGTGDGGWAREARFYKVGSITWHKGNLYILDTFGPANLRVIDSSGRIRSLTAKGPVPSPAPPLEEKLPAARAYLRGNLSGLAISPDGKIYIGDGNAYRIRMITPPALPGCTTGIPNASNCIPSEDGKEVYVFDGEGRHLATKDAFRGVTLLTLNYDLTAGSPKYGQLTSVVDRDGLTTTIARASATSDVDITAPFSQTTFPKLTKITRNASGYATTVVLPRLQGVFETATLTWKPGSNGLLQTLARPAGGGVSTFQYDALGRLISDQSPGVTQALALSRVDTNLGFTVTTTTPEKRVYSVRVESDPAGGLRQVTTDPSGIERQRYSDPALANTTTRLGGAVVSSASPGDAGTRFGMLVPETTIDKADIAAGGDQLALSRTTTQATNAALSNPDDIYSTTSITETTTIDGKIGPAQQATATFTTVTTSSTNTILSTSAEGRQTRRTVDAANRLLSISYPGYAAGSGFATTTFAYNTAACPGGGAGCGGRLTSITHASPIAGEAARTYQMKYDYSVDVGYLAGIVDPLNRRTTFGAWNGTSVTAIGRDNQGRVTKTTLPDGSVVDVGFDLNGNANSVTPPGRSAHGLTTNARDLLTAYIPPQPTPTTLATKDTTYTYDGDRALSTMVMPWDATTRSLLYGYDSGGRLEHNY
jgi:YD repeat-containing protein